MLDAFLNGLIIFKRGPQEQKTESTSQPVTIKRNNVNNIALSLTAEEVISILNLAGVSLSKGELSAVLRKEGHKNYRECGDRYLRNFLKGLAIQYRTVNK